MSKFFMPDENGEYIEIATSEELEGKQDSISDLATIRSGAAAGATALQSVPDLNASKITSGTFADDRIASASTWNAKYTKPSSGIPKTDLALGVQTSLGKADGAMPVTGGQFTGAVSMYSSLHFNVRHINGSVTDGMDGNLYLQYGQNKPVCFGNTGAYYISADGAAYSGTSAYATYSNNNADYSQHLRNSALVSTDTTPSNNGEICWTYA